MGSYTDTGFVRQPVLSASFEGPILMMRFVLVVVFVLQAPHSATAENSQRVGTKQRTTCKPHIDQSLCKVQRKELKRSRHREVKKRQYARTVDEKRRYLEKKRRARLHGCDRR
jgi:sensor histidine kinase YesM